MSAPAHADRREPDPVVDRIGCVHDLVLAAGKAYLAGDVAATAWRLADARVELAEIAADLGDTETEA